MSLSPFLVNGDTVDGSWLAIRQLGPNVLEHVEGPQSGARGHSPATSNFSRSCQRSVGGGVCQGVGRRLVLGSGWMGWSFPYGASRRLEGCLYSGRLVLGSGWMGWSFPYGASRRLEGCLYSGETTWGQSDRQTLDAQAHHSVLGCSAGYPCTRGKRLYRLLSGAGDRRLRHTGDMGHNRRYRVGACLAVRSANRQRSACRSRGV